MFDLPELRRLLALQLGVAAETVIAPGATVEDAALEVVEWARRHNRLCDLANAAAAERAQNHVLQAIARLMPAVAEGGRRTWEPLPENVEGRYRWEQPPEITRPSVQRTLGRVETQIEALRADVAELRQELTTQQAAQRQESERQRAGLRTLLWLVLVLMGGVLGTAGAVAAHAWGG